MFFCVTVVIMGIIFLFANRGVKGAETPPGRVGTAPAAMKNKGPDQSPLNAVD
jgi:hypothetical protein